MPLGQRRALKRPQRVEIHFQGPRGGDLGVELPQATRRRIARIDEHLVATRGRLTVQALETGDRHEHLAARLEQRRRCATQPQRHRGDGAHIGGHILAGDPVAACGRAREDTVLPDHRDRKTVHLRFSRVLHRLVGPEPLAHSPIEGRHILFAEGVVEREHRLPVACLGELIGRYATDALGRRIGRDQ